MKSAVGRYRIRRRVYEAIRLTQAKISKPVDCIFIIYNREVMAMEFRELQKLIADLLKEAEIL